MTTEASPFLCRFSERLADPGQPTAVPNQQNGTAPRTQKRPPSVWGRTRITKIEQETTDDD
jgi:hypothetical protein